MKYRELLWITIPHAYYQPELCQSVRIRPTAATEAMLRRYRLIARGEPGKLTLLMPVDAGGSPLIALDSGMRLMFTLQVVDRDYHLITKALSESERAPLLTNENVDESIAGSLGLDDTSGTSTGIPVRNPDILAYIEIVDPAQYVSETKGFWYMLTSLGMHWVYYLVTDETAGTFAIFDADSSSDVAKVEFGAGDESNEEGDSMLQQLGDRYPNARLLRFVSSERVWMRRAQPRRHVELHLNDNPVRDALPNPSIHSLTRVPDGAGGWLHAWCAVVDYRGKSGGVSAA